MVTIMAVDIGRIIRTKVFITPAPSTYAALSAKSFVEATATPKWIATVSPMNA